MTLAKALEKVSKREHPSKVFDDFLQMVVCCYSMQRSEEIYHSIAKKYDTEELKGFSEALSVLIMAHENQIGWKDYLGRAFEEMGFSNSKTGQFFTPETICNLMCNIVANDKTVGTVNDPSAGSSRNLIAHVRLKPENRFNFFYIAQDLDYRCCLMSVINFVMYGMKGVVIHMDTIKMEIYKGWRIYLPETGLGVVPLTEDECKYYLIEKKQAEQKLIYKETLFD